MKENSINDFISVVLSECLQKDGFNSVFYAALMKAYSRGRSDLWDEMNLTKKAILEAEKKLIKKENK